LKRYSLSYGVKLDFAVIMRSLGEVKEIQIQSMSNSKAFLTISVLLLAIRLSGQNFAVGHSSVIFNDSARNRAVPVEIYYPSDTAGDDVSIATGDFPSISFGHGFLMSWESYESYWKELVPLGYVLCFPTTEMSFSPSHQDFGLDLKFIIEQMQRESGDSASLFFNSISDKSAVMGHSMGGGASFLAAENSQKITALVNFAAAETNPSAIAAATKVAMPSLLFSGDDDCVTPAETNQNPLYDNLESKCKTLVSIINGGHCFFADENGTCSLGEAFCNPALDIVREEQLSITFEYLKPWLDFTLNDNQDAYLFFLDSLETSTRVNYFEACTTTKTEDFTSKKDIQVFPNPVAENLNVIVPQAAIESELLVYSLLGELVYKEQIFGKELNVNTTDFPTGLYLLSVMTSSNRYSKFFVKE